MRFSTFNLFQQIGKISEPEVFAQGIEQIILSERLGFHQAWIGEHHFHGYAIAADPLLVAGHIAARTKRLRLGIAATILPLHNPVLLAEQASLVDILSGGRLDLGLARGYAPMEFAGLGVPLKDLHDRFDENLAILQMALTERTIAYTGKFHNIPEVHLLPGPLQRPHPPIYLAISGQLDSFRDAARRGLPVLIGAADAQTTREREKAYREAAAAAGHSPAKVQALIRATGSMCRVYVARTDEEAWKDAGPSIERFAVSLMEHSMPVHPSLYTEAEFAENAGRARAMAERTRENERPGGRAIIGSPKTCLAKVRELKRLGVRNLICWMNFGGLPHEKIVRSMRLFSREVMAKV